MSISIDRVLHEIEGLPVEDRLELVERIVHSLKTSHLPKQELDWKELYGLGKGLWMNLDGQEYVNQLREDR